jgi:hypothetical protein
LIAAVAFSLSFTASSQQPAAPLSHLDQQFYATLAAGARQSGNFEKTDNVGAATGGAFSETYPDGGILVGFDVWTGDYGPNLVIRGIRPVFQTARGRVRGKGHGNTRGQPDAVIEAKEGYAVAALEARGADRLDGFKVLFWKILPFDVSLDADGSYQSDWVGGLGGAKGRHQLSSDGHPVIGISGGAEDQITRLGLIYLSGN